MTGRESDKQNNYYNPKVVWLLVILVGIAVMVVGLSVFSDREPLTLNDPPGQVLSEDSTTTKDTLPAQDTVTESESEDFSDPVSWQDYNLAVSEADGNDRFVMVYFRGGQCPPCDDMEKSVFPGREIFLDLQYEFLPVKIEQGSNRKITYNDRELRASGLADIIGIPGYPTLLFYDGRTEKFALMLGGFCDAEKLRLTFEFLRKRLFERSGYSLDQFLSDEGYKETSDH